MSRILLCLALLLTACSTSALPRHATAARVLTDVTAESRDLVLAMRASTLASAATHAKINGLDVRAAVVSAAASFDAQGLPRAVDALVAADEAYVRAVLAWAERKEQPAEALPALRAVLVAYEAVRVALGERGDALPKVPGVALSLIGGAK